MRAFMLLRFHGNRHYQYCVKLLWDFVHYGNIQKRRLTTYHVWSVSCSGDMKTNKTKKINLLYVISKP